MDRCISLERQVENFLHLLHSCVELRGLEEGCAWFECGCAIGWVLYEECLGTKTLLVKLENGLFVEPFDALACLPQTVFDAVFRCVCVGAQPVLLALVPPTFVLATVGPVVDAVAFLLIVLVLTIIAHAVTVHIDSESMHVVLSPLTVIRSAVVPKVDSIPVDFVVQPLSVVGGAVSPLVNS